MTSYHGDAYLNRGITDLGQAFGGLIEKKKEDERNRAREFKALQEYADVAGYATKDQTTAMDLDSLKGLVRGNESKTINQERQLRQAELMQRMAAIAQSQQADQSLGTAFQQAEGQRWNDTLNAGQGPRIPRAMTGGDLMNSLARNPQALQSGQLGNLMQAMSRLTPEEQNRVVEGKTATGTPYVTYGNTFQFDPAATAQVRTGAQKEILDYRNDLPPAAKEQFTALQAEKRALIAAKSRALLPELAAPYDAALAAIDAKLAALQNGGTAPTPAAGGATNAPALGFDDFLNWKNKK